MSDEHFRAETRLAPHFVIMANADALKRGALAIWTIYNRPKDYPDGFIARLHEAAKGKTGPTDKTIVGGLDELRHVFYRAGLSRIHRSPGDEPPIVECWL
jgi:hypothetical protein